MTCHLKKYWIAYESTSSGGLGSTIFHRISGVCPPARKFNVSNPCLLLRAQLFVLTQYPLLYVLRMYIGIPRLYVWECTSMYIGTTGRILVYIHRYPMYIHMYEYVGTWVSLSPKLPDLLGSSFVLLSLTLSKPNLETTKMLIFFQPKLLLPILKPQASGVIGVVLWSSEFNPYVTEELVWILIRFVYEFRWKWCFHLRGKSSRSVNDGETGGFSVRDIKWKRRYWRGKKWGLG